MKWKHFPYYWPFVRGIHRSPANSLHKGQWRGALMFSLICAWVKAWVNNREAGDLRLAPSRSFWRHCNPTKHLCICDENGLSDRRTYQLRTLALRSPVWQSMYMMWAEKWKLTTFRSDCVKRVQTALGFFCLFVCLFFFIAFLHFPSTIRQ